MYGCAGRQLINIDSLPPTMGTISMPCTAFFTYTQRYTYRVLQTIQMKLILLCVWADPAVLGSTKTALKFKYEI